MPEKLDLQSIGGRKRGSGNQVEVVEKRPTLEELYTMYDYKPRETVPQRKFLLSSDQIAKMGKALEKVLDLTPFQDSYHERVKLDTRALLEVRFSKVDGIINTKFFDADGTPIANFDCKNVRIDIFPRFSHTNTPDWELAHRFVGEQYRGQEIGSKILQVIEYGIQHVADTSEKTQTITIEARQLGVINFALKNGYEPATPHDKANLDLIYSGDHSKVLVKTAPKLEIGDQERPGFVYSIEDLQKLAKKKGMGDLPPERFWEMNLDKLLIRDFNLYRLYAVNIIFKKEKKPASQPA